MPIINTAFSSFAVCGLLLISPLAHAGLDVNFTESAPKDRFTVTNTGNCTLNDLVLEIDLSNSAGRLIFDTVGGGAGVEVFQPFESDSNIKLVSSNQVGDGTNKLTVSASKLDAGSRFSFTIDVDDVLPSSELGQIRVSDSEIQGATVRIKTASVKSASATFGDASRATVKASLCSAQ